MRIAEASEAVGAMVEDVDVTRLGGGEFTVIRQAFPDHGARATWRCGTTARPGLIQ